MPGLVSGEDCVLGLQMTLFMLCPHMAFSLCMHSPGVFYSSYKDTSPIGLGPHPYDLI